MRAMVRHETRTVSADRDSLVLRDAPEPEPQEGEVLIRVATCGVCHTELDEIEGRAALPRLPVIPGHQVVGQVAACGRCGHCLAGDENLCPAFRATGRSPRTPPITMKSRSCS